MKLKWVHSVVALFILTSSLFLPGDSLARTLFISFSRDHLNDPGDLSLCRHRSASTRFEGDTVWAVIFLLPDGKPPEICFRPGQPCEGPFPKAEL